MLTKLWRWNKKDYSECDNYQKQINDIKLHIQNKQAIKKIAKSIFMNKLNYNKHIIMIVKPKFQKAKIKKLLLSEKSYQAYQILQAFNLLMT